MSWWKIGRDELIAMALCVPTILAWLVRPELFYSDDSYFYLVIARNWAHDGTYSFSNLMETNGFHPLWGWLLARFARAWSHLTPRFGNDLSVWSIPPALVFLGGTVLWTKAAKLLRAPLLLALMPPLFLLGTTHVLASEAHVVFLTLAGFLHGISKIQERAPERYSLPLTGLLAGLTVLARLDTVFFVGMVMACTVLSLGPRLSDALRLGVPAGAVVTPYVLLNLRDTGIIMPISGFLKGAELFSNERVLTLDGLGSTLFGYNIPFGLLPILLGVVVSITAWRDRGSDTSVVIGSTVGCLLHFLYVALMTRNTTGWFWYYVPNVLLAGLSLGHAARRVEAIQRAATSRAAFAFCLLGMAAVLGLRIKVTRPVAVAVTQARWIDQNTTPGDTVLVSDYPGYSAYTTAARVLAADMLTTNYPFYSKLKAKPNGLEFMFEFAERSGHPIRAVVYCGSNYLKHTDDRRTITLNDPRPIPRQVPIGSKFLGDPTWKDPDSVVLAWKLPASATR